MAKKDERGPIRRWVEEHIGRDDKKRGKGGQALGLLERLMPPPMDALEILKAQHDEARAVFAELEESPDRKQFLQLAMALAGHMSIEENILYPALRDLDEEMALYAAEEHLSAKRILADLVDIDVDDPIWLAKLCLLKEQIEHHIEEEESEVFPFLERHLDRDQLMGLGNEMTELMVDAEETNVQGALPEILRQANEGAPL